MDKPLTLQQARELLGLNRQQLADIAGEPRSAIENIELGRSLRPSYALVMNLFRALQRAGLNGIEITDVFPVEDLPAPPSAAPAAREARAR